MYDDNATKQSYITKGPLTMPVKITKRRSEMLAVLRKAYAKLHGIVIKKKAFRTVWVQRPDEQRVSIYPKTYSRR